MNDPWYDEESFARKPRCCRIRPALAALLLGSGIVAGIYHFDPVGRAGYAFQRGRLTAEKEYLDKIAPEVVAGVETISRAFHHVAQVVKPSVVSIQSLRAGSAPDDPIHERLRRFFGEDPRPQVSTSAGSGVVFDHDGHVVTSNHVVAHVDRVDVELADGRRFKARVVGTDPATDVALLKIDADRLHPARFGDSDTLEVGNVVLAVGSPFRLAQTVSHGIVSATGRSDVPVNIDYQRFIQTDAPINPGNSGGPLVNIRGEVVGINTAIATQSGSFAGVGFAIPSNKVRQVVEALMAGRPIERGYLGVIIGPLTPELARSYDLDTNDGVVIQDVIEDGPADEAGLRHDDVILRIDDRPVRSVSQVQEFVAKTRPGKTLHFDIWRDAKQLTIRVGITRQPKGFSTRGFARRTRPQPDDAAPDERDEEVDTVRTTAIRPLGMQVATLSNALIRQYRLTDSGVEHGAIITGVDPTGDAYAAGLRPGYVIIAINGQEIRNRRDLRRALTAEALEQGVRARIVARGERRSIILKTK